MKSRNKYYAITAHNGFMVANSWDRVLQIRKYFVGDRVKGYMSREDAICAAVDEYNFRHEYVFYNGDVEINKPYFSKNIHKNENNSNKTLGTSNSYTEKITPVALFKLIK